MMLLSLFRNFLYLTWLWLSGRLVSIMLAWLRVWFRWGLLLLRLWDGVDRWRFRAFLLRRRWLRLGAAGLIRCRRLLRLRVRLVRLSLPVLLMLLMCRCQWLLRLGVVVLSGGMWSLLRWLDDCSVMWFGCVCGSRLCCG